tara:strand:+ start:547 stop:897 length:351 start_codon:yes stop_codon:yes gene_type:complete
MQDKYGSDEFAVLGFPTDQFGSFAAGSDQEVKSFCQSKYKVKFDLFAKIDVNGEDASPFYSFLTSQDAPPTGKGKVEWNFEKFVLDRQGKVVGRFRPHVKPESREMRSVIEKALAG